MSHREWQCPTCWMPSPPLCLPCTPRCLHASLHSPWSCSGSSWSQPFFWSWRLFPVGSSPSWPLPLCKGCFPHPAVYFYRTPLPRPEANSCSPKYSVWMQITLSWGYGLYLHSRFKAQRMWCRYFSPNRTPRDMTGFSSTFVRSPLSSSRGLLVDTGLLPWSWGARGAQNIEGRWWIKVGGRNTCSHMAWLLPSKTPSALKHSTHAKHHRENHNILTRKQGYLQLQTRIQLSYHTHAHKGCRHQHTTSPPTWDGCTGSAVPLLSGLHQDHAPELLTSHQPGAKLHSHSLTPSLPARAQ